MCKCKRTIPINTTKQQQRTRPQTTTLTATCEKYIHPHTHAHTSLHDDGTQIYLHSIWFDTVPFLSPMFALFFPYIYTLSAFLISIACERKWAEMNGRVCTIQLKTINLFLYQILAHKHTHTHSHTSTNTTCKVCARFSLKSFWWRLLHIWDQCFFTDHSHACTRHGRDFRCDHTHTHTHHIGNVLTNICIGTQQQHDIIHKSIDMTYELNGGA